MKTLCRYLKPICLGLMAGIAVAAPPLAAADQVPAVWEPHEIKFRYAGFTTFYTCSGIRDTLKTLLRAVGARHDVKTDSRCFGDQTYPQPFNTVILGFAVPVPAGEAEPAQGTGPGETFQAEWRKVKVTAGHPYGVERGDCELVEQFIHQVLPEVHARDVINKMTCVPHHQGLGSIRLELTVLVPVDAKKPDK